MNPEAIKAKFTAIQKKAEAANTRQSASRQKWTVGFFLLFVVFGLAFFLMSKWWMPSNITIKHTVPGSSVSLSTYAELTVKRWDFDVTQNLLEVEIEKDAGVIGKDYSYAVNAYGNSSTNQIPLDIVYNGESFFVVQVPNVARFEEILLLVRLDMEEQSYGDYFYCDMEQASRVDIQKEKTDAEYMQLNLLSKADIKEAKKDLKKIMGALSKANPEKAKELAALLVHAKKDGFKPESLEAYRNLFFEGSKYSVAARLEAINVLLPELEAAKNANFADEKEFAALIKHLLSLKKTLKECILAISTEADNDVEVFPSVLKYIQASIKEAAKNEKKRDAAMAKYGVTDGDFYALPPAVRATLPEVILTRDEYISELKEAIDVLINHLNDIKNQGDEEKSSHKR